MFIGFFFALLFYPLLFCVWQHIRHSKHIFVVSRYVIFCSFFSLSLTLTLCFVISTRNNFIRCLFCLQRPTRNTPHSDYSSTLSCNFHLFFLFSCKGNLGKSFKDSIQTVWRSRWNQNGKQWPRKQRNPTTFYGFLQKLTTTTVTGKRVCRLLYW